MMELTKILHEVLDPVFEDDIEIVEGRARPRKPQPRKGWEFAQVKRWRDDRAAILIVLEREPFAHVAPREE